MLSNIGIIFDKKEGNNNDIDNNNNAIILNKEKNKLNHDLMGRDNKIILDNIQYQMIHQSKNNDKDNNKIKEIKSGDKNKKIKKNKFKCVGTLNFDKDGLMIINISNENDQKIDIMRSASKMININQKENEDKRKEKKYTITLDNIPRRIKFIKEKTLKEKKWYEKRKKEMLQGINFDYLNSFKKLFEIYPDLNNLLENDIINKNRNNKIEEYKLDLIKKENDENMNIIGDTNIQLQNGPSNAMKLLLEVYGIPQNFLEENNQLIEYAKKNGIDNDFMFDNLFKDIKTYISEKNSYRKKNICPYNNYKNDKDNEANENIDDDGDLIIESESEEEEEKNNNSKDEKEDKNKNNKHCSFDSKKNKEIIFFKNEENDKDKNGIGKIIDDINKKAEKGIIIGEKTIFSNYKGMKNHSININKDKNEEKIKIENNDDSNKMHEKSVKGNSLIVNKTIELTKNKEIDKEEINKNNILITNSKISTDIFMNALNFCNIDKDNNDNKNSNNIQNYYKDNCNYLAEVNVSKINKENIFHEQKFNLNKEKQLNNKKENETKEKNKIEKFEIKDNNINKYNSNIGNIKNSVITGLDNSNGNVTFDEDITAQGSIRNIKGNMTILGTCNFECTIERRYGKA